MKTKKFLSLLLALAMVFAMSVSVFAGSTNSNEFNATATVKIPAIAVKVPTTGKLFINPMGFKITTASGEAAAVGATAGVTDSQVVSPLYDIENTGPMALKVSVSGVLTPDTSNKALTLATASDFQASTATHFGNDETRNLVFIYAQFGNPTTTNGETTLEEKDYVAGKESEGLLFLTNRAPTSPIEVGKIKAVTTAGEKELLSFRFLGYCNSNARMDWNAGDKVDVKLAFTFKPDPTATTGSNG